MQFYDLVMLAVLGLAIFFGYWKGFAWQVASLAAIIVSYIVARNFSEPLANMIGGDPAWNRFLAMFILFTGTSLLIWLSFGFVKSTIERMHLKGFDRQFGAALGGVKGFIICTLITLFGVSLLGENACRAICTSKSGNYIARVLSHAHGVVPDEISKYVNPYIDKFHKEMDEHQDETPSSPFQPGQPGFENPWANTPNMTQANQPNAPVGRLQPVSGNQSTQQPAVTGRWEAPTQNQGTQGSGGVFQAPPINLPASWQEAVKDGVQGATEKTIQDAQEAWRKAWDGNK